MFPYISICGAQAKSHVGSVKSFFTPVSFLLCPSSLVVQLRAVGLGAKSSSST